VSELAPDERDDRSSDGPFDVLPAAARLAASAWLHAAERSVGVSLELGSRIARAAIGKRESAAPVGPRPFADGPPAPAEHSDATRAALRERGAELLAQSADVAQADELHPAYAWILENLAPDEARILRLLATRGPQPAVDVRRGLPLVSELVAPGLNMIGAEAGCRYPDRVAAYLDNLNRLGLIWFSRETLRDINLYQVLEAQPEAVAAMREAGRTSRTVRRSIHLTPFGSDFCEACLPLHAPDGDSKPEPEVEGSGETAG
jgi:Abortive infection alpha